VQLLRHLSVQSIDHVRVGDASVRRASKQAEAVKKAVAGSRNF
jgi:hypothetical protein